METSEYSTTHYLTSKKPVCFSTIKHDLSVMIKTENNNKIAEGGLRLKNLFKDNSIGKPLITVVTVVINGEKFIEKTIKSVIEQNYDNVEYIVVDGGSTDATLNIIRKYEHAIDYWVSEPDKGIYDAMNKAISLGSGDWINFMNAGDVFFNANILLKIFESPQAFSEFDVIYGNHEVRFSDKIKKVRAGEIKNLWKGSQFCHQSTFVRLSYHKINMFNLRKKIAADFDIFATMKNNKARFFKLCFVISSVSAGGVSDMKRNIVYDEWRSSAKENFLNLYWKINLNYYFLVTLQTIKENIKCFTLKK